MPALIRHLLLLSRRGEFSWVAMNVAKATCFGELAVRQLKQTAMAKADGNG